MSDEPPSARRVVVVDDAGAEPVDVERWARLASAVLDEEGVHPSLELSMTFVPDDVIAGLKAEHLDGDGSPTDVLAFPIDDEPLPGVPSLLGEVVICPGVAAAQAQGNAGCRGAHDGSADAETALLVVHGVLHLLGHDHQTPEETATMRAREEHHLDRWAEEAGS